MATKKTSVKKAAPRAASKSSAKSVKNSGIKRIAYEANPDAHVATGKFRFLLCFMMVAMIIFAGISVCAMSVAISALNQAAEYEACYMEDKNCTLPNKARDKEAEKNQDSTSYYDSETVVDNATESAE